MPSAPSSPRCRSIWAPARSGCRGCWGSSRPAGSSTLTWPGPLIMTSPSTTSRCADVHDIEVAWIDEEDPYLNPMGRKGIGEIGIVGTAAAIGNAVYHATGQRIRDLPITPAKLL